MSQRASTQQNNVAPLPEKVSEKTSDYLTIGKLAEMVGITVRTLRYYEEMDLIGPVKRTEGKYRLYNSHSLKRIKAILALQELGFTLEDTLNVLGAFSKTRDYTKEEQISATRRSLTLQKESIDSKLEQLDSLKQDIVSRLNMLDDVCKPCVSDRPDDENCHETCEYLTEIHT